MHAGLLEAETIYEARAFRLCRETATLPNGVTATIDLVHHPGSSAVVPLLPDNRVVMIKQYRHALRGFLWEIPAGTLDPGEDFLQCARRELIEEAGYQAEDFERITEILPAPGYSDERVQIFLARNLQPAPQRLDEDEVLEVAPLPIGETLAMVKEGRIQDAMTIIGLLLVSARLRGRG
jgi:ADP-ribose pyrophosphatase